MKSKQYKVQYPDLQQRLCCTHSGVADLHDSISALAGLGAAFRALWKEWRKASCFLPSVVQLCLFWIAAATLHITMPAIINVGTVNVTAPAVVAVTTLPGNIIDIGVNMSQLEVWNANPEGGGVFAPELMGIASSVPFIWESKNASIRLPPGLNGT